MRYWYVKLRHLRSLHQTQATQHKVRRPLRRFFGGDWYAWTGNAHKGRRENSILSRYAILSE